MVSIRTMLVAALVAGCGGDGTTNQPVDAGDAVDTVTPGGDASPDAETGCNPIADSDGDAIPSGLEGCEEIPPRDTDGDGEPDWLDRDSDNDGVNDEHEDRNGDGVIGTCTDACTDVSMCPEGYACSIPLGGTSGTCVSPLCADGETDPRNPDMDGDGITDGNEATQICNPRTEDNPEGLKPFKTTDSGAAIDYSEPFWKIALEPDAIEGVVDIDAPEPTHSAYIFDLVDPSLEVAGFLVSRPATPSDGSAVRSAQLAVERLRPFVLPGVSVANLRAAGTRNTSLDGYDTVLLTTIELQHAISDVTVLRQKVVEALSGKPASQVHMPPIGWSGGSTAQFIVVFQTLFRTDRSQVLHMGAVVALEDYDDRTRATGYFADDLANGTQLTNSGNGDTVECEQFLTAEGPKADIIWSLDTSGSMDDDRANVANNSTILFNYATTAGLDFRMGVTDMTPALNGIFATRMTGTSTGDRWLAPSELAQFQANINDPNGPDTGYDEFGPTQAAAAVNRHLPRDDGDPARIREDAKLVVIMVSDEHPQEIENAGILPDSDVMATLMDISDIFTELKPQIDVLQANQALVHAIAVPEPYPACSGGGGEVGYGYLQMVEWFGGVFGSICQPDLGATMQAIIDEVLGSASPIVLEWVPISATISVSRDGQVIPRSRQMGWDYNASSNSIVFFGIPFDPDNPSEIVVSYRRWSEQVPVE